MSGNAGEWTWRKEPTGLDCSHRSTRQWLWERETKRRIQNSLSRLLYINSDYSTFSGFGDGIDNISDFNKEPKALLRISGRRHCSRVCLWGPTLSGRLWMDVRFGQSKKGKGKSRCFGKLLKHFLFYILLNEREWVLRWYPVPRWERVRG